MRPYVILALIGVVVAALAAALVRTSTSAPQEGTEAAAPITTTRVIVAREDIPAGTFIRPETHLTWGDWPSEKVQSPPYMTEQAGQTLEGFAGAVARRAIYAGEPIPQTSLVKSGEGGFMAAVLQPGMRAVSVAVNATSGNAGFIFPGDNVDLILTHTISTMSGDAFASETFVENARVLAVDQLLDNPENKALLAKTITLEVTPRQAEAINVASEMGKISLSLRSLGNAEDTAAIQTDGASTEASAKTAETPSEPANTVDVDYFYPDSPPSAHDPNANFTRDRDISTLLGSGDNAPAQKVRVIRGDTQSEIEFQQPPR